MPEKLGYLSQDCAIHVQPNSECSDGILYTLLSWSVRYYGGVSLECQERLSRLGRVRPFRISGSGSCWNRPWVWEKTLHRAHDNNPMPGNRWSASVKLAFKEYELFPSCTFANGIKSERLSRFRWSRHIRIMSSWQHNTKVRTLCVRCVWDWRSA